MSISLILYFSVYFQIEMSISLILYFGMERFITLTVIAVIVFSLILYFSDGKFLNSGSNSVYF